MAKLINRYPAERVIRRLLQSGNLASIDVTFHVGGVSARAEPNGFHPLVKRRREQEMALAGPEGLSLAQAAEIQRQSMRAVATANGDTLADAVSALEAALFHPDALEGEKKNG